jgi:hypothetical protein
MVTRQGWVELLHALSIQVSAVTLDATAAPCMGTTVDTFAQCPLREGVNISTVNAYFKRTWC